jgi:hypothetical protein
VTLIRFFIIIAQADETFSDILITAGVLDLIRILEDHRKGEVYTTHIACECCELGYILPDDIETAPHIARNLFFYQGDDRHSEFPELWSSQWDKYPGDIEGSDYHSFWTLPADSGYRLKLSVLFASRYCRLSCHDCSKFVFSQLCFNLFSGCTP